MDHAEATNTQATERYLLGDLNAAEADAFEEHFFDCAECADELRVGMRVLSGGRELAREAAAPTEAPVVPIETHRRRRSAWLPAAAAAALILSVTAPLLLRQPASEPSFEVLQQKTLFLDDMRGASDVPTIDGNATVALWVDVPPQPAYARYEGRLHAPDGEILTLTFTPDPDGAPTPLKVHGLSAGAHELALVGFSTDGRDTEIKRHRFNVRR